MINKPHFVIVFLAGVLLNVTATFGQDLEKALNDQYRDKVLTFRHPFETGSQEYDSAGKLLSTLSLGSWAHDGRMLVEKILLSDDKLTVEGKRELYRFNERNGHLTSAHSGENVKVVIRLDTPLASADQASPVLARVFATADDKKRSPVPSDWPPHDDHTVDQSSGSEAKGNVLQGEKVFSFSEGVTPPRILKSHAPALPPGVRSERGKVGLNILVDSAGHAQDVKIVHSLNKALDESAVDAVKLWRFRPAMKNGVPVATAIYLEIDFFLN